MTVTWTYCRIALVLVVSGADVRNPVWAVYQPLASGAFPNPFRLPTIYAWICQRELNPSFEREIANDTDSFNGDRDGIARQSARYQEDRGPSG
jgi:hypothetical protein